MVDLWFFLVGAMFAAYVVLDGYDLGAGIVSPFVGRADGERRAVLDTILPYWDGNEVFLVAGGATLYLAFPRLFPAFVSGFYLPVMIVLWLLALRGIAIEMRHKLDHPLWNQLWDGGFFFASLLLVLFFGAALGNVVRGVSVEENGEFFAPLWTNFRVANEVGILDWYTLLVGATAVTVVARHGALRIAARVKDPVVAERSKRLAAALGPVAIGLAAIATVATFNVQPHVQKSLGDKPWAGIVGLVAFGGLVASWILGRRKEPKDRERAYWASSASLASLIACACIGVHPYGMLARVPERSVLATAAAADSYAMSIGLAWWIPGMALVVASIVFVHKTIERAKAKEAATLQAKD